MDFVGMFGPNWLSRLVCEAKGHKRGKFKFETYADAAGPKIRVFQCPRCGRETRYKAKDNAPSKDHA